MPGVLTAADDRRHTLRPPDGRESLFFGVTLPEEGLQVMAYTWVDAAGRAGRFLTVFDEGERRHVYDAAGDLDATGLDFDDWRLQGMTVRHIDPLRSAEVGFDSEQATCRLRFEGLHDAFPYSANAAGCPPKLADDRFEQSCRVTGSLAFGDRTIEIDDLGHRDHSWGTRDWDAIQHHTWVSAQAGPDRTMNAMYVVIEGRLTVHGYVLRDGHLAAITAVDPLVEHDERFRQRAGRIVLHDDAGRRTEVAFERFAITGLKSGRSMVLHECGARCDFDGVPGVLHAEMAWNRDYVAGRVAARDDARAR